MVRFSVEQTVVTRIEADLLFLRYFDVVTHRTIFYKNATHLSQELKKLISEVYGKKI